MSEVGIRELKAHLSAHLRRLKAGETLTITDHGRRIGHIIPESQSVEQRIEAMQQAGLAAWSGRKPRAARPGAVNRGKRLVSDLLVEDRE